MFLIVPGANYTAVAEFLRDFIGVGTFY